MAGIQIVCDCVKGKSHSACEDFAHAQALEVGEESDIVLFAVADGHGSPACVRSARGSELAVRVAIRWLERLANSFGADQDQWGRRLLEDVQERMATPRSANGPNNARGLSGAPAHSVGTSASPCDAFAKSLVTDWRRAVIEDADPQTNPLTEAELQAVHDSGYRWEEGHLFRLYGTTLIAGVLLPDAVFLLQQGDGCCSVLYEGGEALDPMPEDERCVGNVTTSMCDDDAERGMRFAYVDRRRRDPIACFVATDGVDKSVSGNDGVENFFRGVVMDAVSSRDEDEATSTLRETLELLSTQGARDDTSIAGFIDVDRAARSMDALAANRQRFDRELEIRSLEERQLSLSRGVERYRSAEAECERFRPWVEEHEQNQRRIDELRGLASGGAHADAAASAQASDAVPEPERPAASGGRTRPGAANPERAAQPSVAYAPTEAGQSTFAPGPRAGKQNKPILLFVGAAVVAAAIVACVFLIGLKAAAPAPGDAAANPPEPTASSEPTGTTVEPQDQLTSVKDALRERIDEMLRSKTLVEALCGAKGEGRETSGKLEDAEADDAAQHLACACMWTLCDRIEGLDEGSVEWNANACEATLEFPTVLSKMQEAEPTGARTLLRDAREQLEDASQAGESMSLRFDLELDSSNNEWRVVSVNSQASDGLESQIGEAIGFGHICELATSAEPAPNAENTAETYATGDPSVRQNADSLTN